jgi:alpha-D-ribose 1-methylphosphonate 5-triphosphate synthase subunit PhnH
MSLDRPGFADPVADAQGSFRAILDALSHPGRVVEIAAPLDPPAPLSVAVAAVLLTLADGETTLALPADAAPVREWIAFHCGTAFAAPAQADFVLASSLPDLATLRPGTDEEPESGATLILQMPSLDGGKALRLRGPGIETSTSIAPPLPADFVASWGANHARFPRGVDIFLCAGNRLMALPRSVMIEEG